MNDATNADAQMVPNPSKAHRTLCTCGAEPEAYKLRTGIKLLADKVRSMGYENRKQESNGELVGRFIWDATPPAEVAALRGRAAEQKEMFVALLAELGDLKADNARLRAALEGLEKQVSTDMLRRQSVLPNPELVAARAALSPTELAR